MESAVKIILTNKENKILLQLRDKGHSHTGHWSLFGGHIDGDETPEEALVREIKEEINYTIKKYEFFKEVYVEEFGKVYFFHGTIDVGLDQLTLLEGDDFGFFTYEEAKSLQITPASGKVIIEYFEHQKKGGSSSES